MDETRRERIYQMFGDLCRLLQGAGQEKEGLRLLVEIEREYDAARTEEWVRGFMLGRHASSRPPANPAPAMVTNVHAEIEALWTAILRVAGDDIDDAAAAAFQDRMLALIDAARTEGADIQKRVHRTVALENYGRIYTNGWKAGWDAAYSIGAAVERVVVTEAETEDAPDDEQPLPPTTH
jgi:hypothetical protein